MKGRSTLKEFTPGRGYTKEDWDAVDSPEATPEQLRRGRTFAEAFPDLAASIRRGRGPQKAPKKVQVSLRLDPAAVAAFRATGPGWQARIGDAVKAAAERLRRPNSN